MKLMHQIREYRMAWVLWFAICLLPRDAAAYIDPGTTGILSQVLYVLFYGALGGFFYFLKFVKSRFAKSKNFLSQLISRHP